TMVLCPMVTEAGGKADLPSISGPRPMVSNPAQSMWSPHPRHPRLSAAKVSTAYPTLCQGTRLWWWSTHMIKTRTCF
ncbi:hypothetical protein STEG23_024698, partial [Scotinomys teguina]